MGIIEIETVCLEEGRTLAASLSQRELEISHAAPKEISSSGQTTTLSYIFLLS